MSIESTFRPSVCLAILNYNGRGHLNELLPTAIKAVAYYGHPCPIIVLDNKSPNDDVAWVKENYPEVEVAVSQTNDYVFSYNWLLPNRSEDVVILLNNDLKLSNNIINCLIRHFANPTAFAVGSKSLCWDTGSINSGPCKFEVLKRGWVTGGFQKERQSVAYTLFSGGGAVAVHRKKFVELGGFDRLYYPAYGEDKDLCFRAWCKGWKSLYEPGCHVFHREGGSWDEQNNRSKKLIEITNYLFMWRNFRSWRFRIAHHIYLTWLCARKRIERDIAWLETLREAKLAWQERKQLALQNAPRNVDLNYLKQICGSPVID